MPRIPPTLLRRARQINRLLPPLLPVCRDLSSSQNELRWLGEHAADVACRRGDDAAVGHEKQLLQQYVARRAKGEPLQYILGTEFFGDLEIACRPGVLVPRQETAASVSHLAKLLIESWKNTAPSEPVNVLDLCTGSGCIPLLFHHELFNQPHVKPYVGQIVGVDVSQQALRLSEENKTIQCQEQNAHRHNTSLAKLDALRNMQFIQADVLADLDAPSGVMNKLRYHRPERSVPNYDILISNPPYISTSAFRTTTAASVRKFEPKLALVPPTSSSSLSKDQCMVEDGDLFYPRLFKIAESLGTKVVLFEVADLEQACRVAGMAGGCWDGVEIWRDDPAAVGGNEAEYVNVGRQGSTRDVRVRGRGNGRSVVAFRGEGGRWVDCE